jgi:hypothetical protein
MWLLLACTGPDPQAPDTPAPLAWDDESRWLCRPDLAQDACDIPLDVTAVQADGSTELVPHVPAAQPVGDCFYVYPTNSLDPTPQSDLVPGPEERFVVGMQAARYGAVCRVFAPVYRQVTISGLFAEQGDFELAYADVLEAFQRFLRDSGDRPFLLLGHSQGSMHLSRLLAEQIEPDEALARRLVAAHLIGGFVTTATGQDVGGSFASTPVCLSPEQTGCVVHYNSFREDEPPDESALFGLSPSPEEQVVCAHPAALAGGEAPLGAVLPLEVPPELAALLGPQPGPFQDPETAPALDTPFYALPGLVHGACTTAAEASYLAVSVRSDPEDPRADDIGGDLLPGWGLHLVDVSLAGLDLVELARQQLDAWAQAQ